MNVISGGRQKGPNGDDGCALSGITDHTLIILDRTDPIPPNKYRAIANTIWTTVREMSVGEKLTICEIDSKYMRGLSQPIFSKCVPRDGSQADPFTENAKLLEAKYKKTFQEPLERTIAKYQMELEQPRSPIIESIMDCSDIKDFGAGTARRKLILFSDLLQHTKEFSQYRHIKPFNEISKTILKHKVPNLNNVEIYIYYLIQTNDKGKLYQTNEHVQFWIDFFEATKGKLIKIKKIR